MFKEALLGRQNQYKSKLGELALERLRLIKRMEDIDISIKQLDAAIIENDQALKDFATQEAIDKASKDATEQK